MRSATGSSGAKPGRHSCVLLVMEQCYSSSSGCFAAPALVRAAAAAGGRGACCCASVMTATRVGDGDGAVDGAGMKKGDFRRHAQTDRARSVRKRDSKTSGGVAAAVQHAGRQAHQTATVASGHAPDK